MLLPGRLAAQVVLPNPNRAVHPGIADPAPGLVLRSAPLFAVPDGTWNHGEGFAPGNQSDADFCGWFANGGGYEDGSGVEISDVHFDAATTPWANFGWSSPFYNGGASTTVRRHVGWLRPNNLLPTTHPKYGPVGEYVDQGAFEIFIPTSAYPPGRKLLLCILTWQTIGVFPQDAVGRKLGWRQTYPGLFSKDGLMRNELPPGTPQSFPNNTDTASFDPAHLYGVIRPSLEILASWNSAVHAAYWPIVAYIVPSVINRQTTLNEQRYLQLMRAIKLLLQQPTAHNPLGATGALTEAQVEELCVVCWAGGSNGGLAAEFAALRFPRLVHGAFAEVIDPSYQRLYSEHDGSQALSRLSGAGPLVGGLSADDYMHWGQYVWSQGLEMHDMSFLRHYLSGKTYRPALFGVGDEDITSTGTDWVRVLSPTGAWADHGVTPPSGLPASQSYFAHDMAWMVAQNGCHQWSVVPVTHPYTSQPNIYNSIQIAHDLFARACAQRNLELASPTTPPPPATPLTHEARSAAQQLHGPDDPHEWFLGRAGEALPPPACGPLLRDDAFFQAVQPHSCGTMPLCMFVRDNKVYVGSADGFVSAFRVANGTKQQLELVARSPRLGHSVTALADLDGASGWSVVAGTRRHIQLLDRDTLQPKPTPAPYFLPWEVAQPYHMKVADVLDPPGQDEIIFASLHGGLVFLNHNLVPLHEWPEPGIVDFAVLNRTLTIASSRGVLANVTFAGPNHTPTLVAATNPLPANLDNPQNPEPPGQGSPLDMELMDADLSIIQAGANAVAVMSLWGGDTDGYGALGTGSGVAIRPHVHATLGPVPLAYGGNEKRWIDLATCKQSAGYAGSSSTRGDHLLALANDGTLALFDQFGLPLASVDITATAQGYWPFGKGAHSMVVGELVGNGGSYEQEIVIATNTGLMWLHVNDLFASGSVLPATAGAPGYWMDVARGSTPPPAGTMIQPRTNQTLAAAWAMARRPDASSPTGLDGYLHVLDQRGVYWRVSPGGQVQLWDRMRLAAGARNWGYVGTVTAAGPSFTLPLFGGYLGVVSGGPGGADMAIGATPWYAQNGGDAVYQFANPPVAIADNWVRNAVVRAVFDGFLAFERTGSVLPLGGGLVEAWMWSSAGDWANLVEGYSIASGVVGGTWSSVAEPTSISPNGFGTGCSHLRLRSFSSTPPAMQQEAVQAVKLFNGQTALVLGCPGGRVRVKLLAAPVSPNPHSPDMRTGNGAAQNIGSIAASSDDLGFGGGALAVRHEGTAGNETLRIWFGTTVHPTPRPGSYHLQGGALSGSEVVTGAIHMMTWQSSGMSPVSLLKTYYPVALDPRGAYGVVGMKVANLLPNVMSTDGDELIVATISGDLFVYNIDPVTANLTEVCRTWVLGAIGFHNSIAVEDLNNDGHMELYVAGSLGLWRFIQSGEITS